MFRSCQLLSLVVLATTVVVVNGDDVNNASIICATSSERFCTPESIEHHRLTTSTPAEMVTVLRFSKDENATRYRFCFPENKALQVREDRAKFKLMAHVTCRELGFMTYLSSHEGQELESPGFKHVLPSVVCNGTEQRLRDCYWPEVVEVSCKSFVLLKCGSCSHEYLNVNEGEISTPGYPYAFFPLVQCEWKIRMDFGEMMELKFDHFELPEVSTKVKQCLVQHAYLELKVYPKYENAEINAFADPNRYCVVRNPTKVLNLKSRTTTIHFSSGLFAGKYSYPNGIKIRYRMTIPRKADSSLAFLAVIMSACVGVFILVFLMYHLCKCCGFQNLDCNRKYCKNGSKDHAAEMQMSDRNIYEEPLAPHVPPKSISLYHPVSRRSRQTRTSFAVSLQSLSSPLSLRKTQAMSNSDGQAQYLLCHEIETHDFEREKLRAAKSLQPQVSGAVQTESGSPGRRSNHSDQLTNTTEATVHDRCGRRLQECLAQSSEQIESGHPATICCSVPAECVELFKTSPEVTLSSSTVHSKKRLLRSDATFRTPPDISIVDVSGKKTMEAKSV